MLPEKKKRLIIALISVVIIIITVCAIYKLSSYIRSRNNNTTIEERNNDEYPSDYSYIGVLKDKDNIYKLYGIKDKEEKYLNVRTFYDIKDIITKDNKLVLYSDAMNELRFDKEKDEFYFYELDSNYNNKYSVYLSENHIVTKEDKVINYRKINESEEKNITNKAINDEIFVNNNKVYYVLSDGVHQFDLESLNDRVVVYKDKKENIILIGVTTDYIFISKDDKLIAYKFQANKNMNIENYLEGEYSFIDVADNGFLIKQDDEIKEYTFVMNKVLEKTIPLDGYEIKSSKYLQDSLYYMTLAKDDEVKSVIINKDKKEIVKEFENNYLYLWRANEN